jgi:hypothetical protein
MALPVILVNATGGSDTQASGAGPSTALFGTTDASTDGAGTTVTLTAGTDLTNVATDGSHVIFLNDSTAGARNFGKITAKAGSGGATPTVTVADAFGLTLSGKSWAIGGKRASIGSTTSAKLIENNAGNGDAMPGWAIEMQSGHTETIAATINPRRNGDATTGRIILRGTSVAGTMPIVTFSNNGDGIVPRGNLWTFRDFELQNSNATKTSSQAFNSLGSHIIVKNIRCNHATNKFWKIYHGSGGSHFRVEDCNWQNAANVGIGIDSTTSYLQVENCVIANCGSHGINIGSNADVSGLQLIGNIIAFNATDGFNSSGMTNNSLLFNWLFRGNVFHGNGGDGIEIPQTSSQSAVFIRLTIENNEFTYNGGYGINFSGASMSDVILDGFSVAIRNNAFYTNTSGKYAGMTVAMSFDEVTTDPSGGSASATKDYAGTTGGTNFMSSVHKAKGYPIGGTLAVGSNSSSYNYQDIGLQHQDAGGGTTAAFVIGE